MNSTIHPEDFYKGLELFNRGFYYECHDVWEEVWGDAKGKERIFYQALIVTAVSLYHFGNDNLDGALSCYQKALNHFEELPDRFLALDIRQFVTKLKEFYSELSPHTELTDAVSNRERPKLKLEDWSKW